MASGEAEYSEDSETPDILPILRGSRLHHAKSDEIPGQTGIRSLLVAGLLYQYNYKTEISNKYKRHAVVFKN